jgi:hypothetical protein
VWDNDVSRRLVSNHEAVFASGQLDRHQQTQARIELVLVDLPRALEFALALDPLAQAMQATCA